MYIEEKKVGETGEVKVEFLSAEKLKITEDQRKALIQVYGMMERNEIPRKQFSMRYISCGTAHCIQGWCRTFSNDFYSSTKLDYPKPLLDLFMYSDRRRWDCTLEQAKLGLYNYLTRGSAHWNEMEFPIEALHSSMK
jgi:hypothetical protein